MIPEDESLATAFSAGLWACALRAAAERSEAVRALRGAGLSVAAGCVQLCLESRRARRSRVRLLLLARVEISAACVREGYAPGDAGLELHYSLSVVSRALEGKKEYLSFPGTIVAQDGETDYVRFVVDLHASSVEDVLENGAFALWIDLPGATSRYVIPACDVLPERPGSWKRSGPGAFAASARRRI